MYKGKYIYKVVNQVNGKAYIGQTVNPQKRFSDHMSTNPNRVGNPHLASAVRKYGRKNFVMKIIGFYENYNAMEEIFIKEYDSIVNGYNILSGGDLPPVRKGEKSHMAKLTKSDVLAIINLLIERDKTLIEIAKEFDCERTAIKRINNGVSWHNKKIQYPIRHVRNENKILSSKIKKEILKGQENLKRISERFNISYSRVKAINTGQNYHEKNYKYPLLENINYNKAVSTISLIGE